MITLEQFIILARYTNEVWRGKFTDEEILENANEWFYCYNESIKSGFPTFTMRSLCEGLVEDMDFMDYGDIQTTLDNDTMNTILLQYINEEVQ